MPFAILFITILFVSVIQIFTPFLVKRTVVFGVTIPYEQVKHPKVIHYKKLYATITSVVAVIVLGVFFFLNKSLNETTMALSGVLIPFVVLLIGLLLYFYFHSQMSKLKQSQGWYGEVKQVYSADLAARSQDEMLSSLVYLLPIIISAGVIILTANVYHQLPSRIPTHFGADGKPDAYSNKGWGAVLALPLILIVMQFMFLTINYFTKQSGIKINAGNAASSKLRQLRLRKYTSWFLFFVDVTVSLLFALLQLNVLFENFINATVLILLPIGLMFIVLTGAIWFALKVGSVDSDFDGKVVIENPSKVEGMDEDQYWKGGLFYFNKNDPSVFVEKRFGIGYTINFANPIGYLILLLPIVLILIIPFLIEN
jgi:uncharacterized membrane protein